MSRIIRPDQAHPLQIVIDYDDATTQSKIGFFRGGQPVAEPFPLIVAIIAANLAQLSSTLLTQKQPGSRPAENPPDNPFNNPGGKRAN